MDDDCIVDCDETISWQPKTISLELSLQGKFGAFWVREGKVVGVFLEGGTPDENITIKSIARAQPDAPPPLTLSKTGALPLAQSAYYLA